MNNDKTQVQIPYRGDLPYIFVSYSHRNMDATMEIVKDLQSDGYRIWYDEGIDPGSEWDENIAVHIERCGFFIALLSKEYLDSSNCKDELNYARELEKPRLLIYLEELQLPGGMQMRLSRLQAIHKYRYIDKKQFYEKVYASRGIRTCYSDNELVASSNLVYAPNNTKAEFDSSDVTGKALLQMGIIEERNSNNTAHDENEKLEKDKSIDEKSIQSESQKNVYAEIMKDAGNKYSNLGNAKVSMDSVADMKKENRDIDELFARLYIDEAPVQKKTGDMTETIRRCLNESDERMEALVKDVTCNKYLQNSEGENFVSLEKESTKGAITLCHLDRNIRFLYIVDNSVILEESHDNLLMQAIRKVVTRIDLRYPKSATVDVLQYGENLKWISMNEKSNTSVYELAAESITEALIQYGKLLPSDTHVIIYIVSKSGSANNHIPGLQQLSDQSWYQNAGKIGFAVGNEADYTLLYKMTENKKAVADIFGISELVDDLTALPLFLLESKDSAFGLTFDGSVLLYKYYAKKKERDKAAAEILRRRKSSTEDLKKQNSTKKVKELQYCFFGAKRATKCFKDVPSVLEIPEKVDIILSNAFQSVAKPKEFIRVKEVIVPESVIEIRDNAFAELHISKSIKIPASVKVIGNNAFVLEEGAKVICEKDSDAYKYCVENGIRNSIDIERWKKEGKCEYCGGTFSLFSKKCKRCGRSRSF